MGDFAAKRHPQHGRIFACQFSVAIGIPFSLLILKVCIPGTISYGHATGSMSVGCLNDSPTRKARHFLCAGVARQWEC